MFDIIFYQDKNGYSEVEALLKVMERAKRYLKEYKERNQ